MVTQSRTLSDEERTALLSPFAYQEIKYRCFCGKPLDILWSDGHSLHGGGVYHFWKHRGEGESLRRAEPRTRRVEADTRIVEGFVQAVERFRHRCPKGHDHPKRADTLIGAYVKALRAGRSVIVAGEDV